MQGLIEINNDEEVTLGELYDELVERIDYLNFLKSDDPESAEDRAANVQELASNPRVALRRKTPKARFRIFSKKFRSLRTSIITIITPIPSCS